MTDAEITKLCAEAMGLKAYYPFGPDFLFIEHPTYFDRDASLHGVSLKRYDPLHNDAQAMPLLRRFTLEPRFNEERQAWHVTKSYASEPHSWSESLSHAICECVALMQKGRNKNRLQPGTS